DVRGPLAHRRQRQDFGRAQGEEEQREQHREDGRSDAHDSTATFLVTGAYLTTVRWVPRSIAPSSVATVASIMSPSCRYFGFLAWRAKKAFHFTAGGRNEARIWAGFGGALRAVPTGVPVSSRSPASRRWNRVSACSVSTGR